MIELQATSPVPSRLQVKLANPDVASEAELINVTGLRYHPFKPVVPVMFDVMLGSWESTFVVSAPMVELSPNEESAQYVKSLLPWINGTLQFVFVHPKVCPFNVPSMAKML